MATGGRSGGRGYTRTTHVVVIWGLFTSCCVVSANDEAGTTTMPSASVKSWGTSDQTSVVGRLFELSLSSAEDGAVLTVS